MTSIPTTMHSANPGDAISALRASINRVLAPAAANDRAASTPALTKSIAHAVDTARQHLRTGNPGAYARALAGEHRAANTRQQRAIEAVIAADACERLFTRHPANGCLMAREG